MQRSAYQQDGVQYVEIIAAIFGAYKRRALAALDVRAGNRVLDVGCGVGDDVRMLAAVAGPDGRVTGVDRSRDMIEAARKRSVPSERVEFVVGDSYELPFPDEAFDRVRADRLFQHLERPQVALAEMIRVAKKGGIVCVVDVDWSTLLVNSDDADTTKRILEFHVAQQVNGTAGRQLFEQFKKTALTDVTVYADAVCVTEWAVAKWVWGLEIFARRAAEAGMVEPERVDDWLRHLEDKDRAGHFFSSMTGFAAQGVKA